MHQIDHDGLYPAQAMRALGSAGLFAQHLAAHSPRPSIAAAIDAMAAVGETCMSTAFCTWCQDASGWFPLSDAGSDMMIDSAATLAAVGDDRVVKLDVRDVDEWIGTSSSPYGPDFCPRKGRIPGARWLEWYRLMKPTGAGPMFKTPDEIMAEAYTVGISPATPVYLYCFKGARASNTLVALEAGVRMYFGSWNEWSRDESLPIETGMPFAQAAE